MEAGVHRPNKHCAFAHRTSSAVCQLGCVNRPISHKPAMSLMILDLSAIGWLNNATLGIAGPIIVDGAKRDRAVWPGDMGIAVPTQFVSTLDLLPTRNALSTQFSAINPKTGALPESGEPHLTSFICRLNS